MDQSRLCCDWRLGLLTEFCPQNNNWILQLNYQDVVSHVERKMQTFVQGRLVQHTQTREGGLCGPPVHIYFNYMTNDRLVALVATESNDLILIDNMCEIDTSQGEAPPTPPSKGVMGEEAAPPTIKLNEVSLPKIKGVKSVLTYLTSVSDLASRELFSRSFQKTLGIFKWWEKCNNQKESTTTLPLPLLLLKVPHQQRVVFLHTNKLDLTGVLSLTDTMLEELPVNENVNYIVLDQNCQIGSFKWLARFKGLTILELHQCQQINNGHIAEICQNVRGLEAIILDHCCGLNIRCVLPLLNLTKLRLIKVNYPNFSCQPSEKEVYVTKTEWSNHCSYSLEQLEIDSTSMTLDVLDYLIKSCPNVKTLSVSDETLRDVAKNAVFDDTNKRVEDALNFHQASDPRKGIRASRPIRFKNMFKDNFSMPFSKALLAKIQKEGGIIAPEY